MIRLDTVLFKGKMIKDWVEYFNYNKTHLLKLDYKNDIGLTVSEKELITPSIKAFQVGEGSSGSIFINLARQYANDTDDLQYIEEVQAFIGEENRHSKTLEQFMKVNDITVAKSTVLDQCFRFVRHKSSLKWEIIVLVTAEMIALSYYTALSRVTNSKLLKQICRQMLRDELRHIIFQSQMLGKLQLNRGEQSVRKILMLFTANIVWFVFFKLFKKGNYSYKKFISECFGYLRQSGTIAILAS